MTLLSTRSPQFQKLNATGAFHAAVFGLLMLALQTASQAVTLTYEMRFSLSAQPAGSSVSADGKAMTISSPGDVVQLELYALVSNADGSFANDGFNQGHGSFVSSNGSLLGDFRGDPAGGTATQTNNVAPFNSTGAQSGFAATAFPFDNDGDIDVGGNTTTGPGVVPFFVANAGGSSVLGSGAGTGAFGQLIGRTTFTLSLNAGAGLSTLLNFIPRDRAGNTGVSQLHQFTSDGTRLNVTGHDASNPVLSGQALTIQLVPEPCTISLLLAGTLGLFTVRRRRGQQCVLERMSM